MEEPKPASKRWLLFPLPVLLGAGLAAFFLGNPLAGALLGLSLGWFLHGHPTREAIRGDQFATRLRYRHPVWLRRTVGAIALAAAVLFFLRLPIPEVAFLEDRLQSPYGLWTGAATLLLSLLLGLSGSWRKLASYLKDRRAQAKATTPDAKALLRFSEDTLRQAGLSSLSDVAREELLPTILEKTLDPKGRAVVRVAPLMGKQTVADLQRASDRLASAWAVPRVEVSRGEDLKDGRHTALLMAVLQESRAPELVAWEPMDTNLPVVDYLSRLPMGAKTSDGEPWELNLRAKNFVVGGQPGSGKTSFVNALIAHLIRHPHVRVHYIDLKNGADSELWATALNGTTDNSSTGSGVEGALRFVREAREDLRRRFERMRAQGVNNAWTSGFLGEEEPVKLLVVDECSELFKRGTKEERETTTMVIEELKSFIQQGRAAGYILLMATQFPKEENLPNSLRAVASDSICFRVKATGVAATLGGDFVWGEHNNPTRSKTGEAVVLSEEVEGERIKIAFLSREKQDEVMAESAIAGKSFFDSEGPTDIGRYVETPPEAMTISSAESYLEEEETLQEEEELPMAEYPVRPKRQRPVWED